MKKWIARFILSLWIIAFIISLVMGITQNGKEFLFIVGGAFLFVVTIIGTFWAIAELSD